MPILVEKLRDEPIITVTFEDPINYMAEVPEAFDAILIMRDAINGSPRYFIIFDVSRVQVGIDEIVLTLGEAKQASKMRRPDLPLSLSIVGSGGLIEMAANAMEQAQYGAYQMPLFTSLDQALAAARAQFA
jgi:hypothetical protein